MNEHPTDDLALYALGLVDERERDSIARHLDTCATCREELRAHEATLAALAQSAERAAPRGLRERVVARERRRSWLDLPRLALAGSFVAAILLAAVAVVSVRQLDDVRAQRDEYARALEQVAEGARVVRLQTKTAGRAALVVPAGGPAMLLLDLPAPPEGKQYEAWVIRGGAAARAGQVPRRDGVVSLTLSAPVAPGDVAAVTVEVTGGVDQPTSEPIVAGGI